MVVSEMCLHRKVQHLEAELETFEDKLLLAAQKLDVVRMLSWEKIGKLGF